MKKLLFIFLTILLSSQIIASSVDTIVAKTVGLNFLNERKSTLKNINDKNLELVLLQTKNKNTGQSLFYIFNFKNEKGYIIIAAHDEIFPVLSYSFENNFDPNADMPDAMKEWLEVTEYQIKYILNQKLRADIKTQEAWKTYRNSSGNEKRGLKSVSPLLATTWNQGTYYNALCPADPSGPNGRVWAGCVAVCMAQVMKYCNYPDYGSGDHSYESYPYGTQSANFAETYYDWNSMPNSLSSGNIAVATLMYHCGVAVNMHYDPDGSGAFMGSAASALINYFDYAPDVQLVSKYSYSETTWDSILKTELDLGRPIAYAGGSHAFNIDGYEGENHYHVNWGWGGSYNNYFYLSALNPGSSNFTSGQQAIIHIRPNCGLSTDLLTIHTSNSGTISDNGGTMKNYLNCSGTKTLISPPGISKIKLLFSEFKTVDGQDTLYVYDGENENAPLLLALTGSHDPFETLSSGNKLFLKFNSDAFTTDKGYTINYISAFDDTGISGFILPKNRTCGVSDDSIMVVVKNYGINTKSTIPVTVKVNTPLGTLTFNKTFTKSLATNQFDTLFIGYINTSSPGDYQYTCYTRTTGDNIVNSNDTLVETVIIKEIESCPFSENLENLNYQMGDWKDFSQRTWINMDNDRSNSFFRAYVGGGETGGIGGDRENQNPFLIYDRKIGTITPDAFLYFDYRILGWGQVPVPTDLNANQKIKILVSSDCGGMFDTLFTIDSNNHVSDSSFQQLKISLGQYTGQNIILGFTTHWDNVMASVDYDNFLVVDSTNAAFNETFSNEEDKLEIYPNPVSTFVTVKKIKHSEKNVGLSILDITGKKIKEINAALTNESVKFDVTDLPSGIYFIRIYTDKKVINGKFCKTDYK